MNLYIGIDLGTSAVKLLLVDETGEILRTVTREYPLHFPQPGWSEQDPADWWEAVREGILQLTAEADRASIRGIGCGGQMHGLVALDENDAVIRPAILWNDGRTTEETEWLNTAVGKEKLSQLTANIAFAGFTAPKLLWMQKHEPENFRRIKKSCCPRTTSTTGSPASTPVTSPTRAGCCCWMWSTGAGRKRCWRSAR